MKIKKEIPPYRLDVDFLFGFGEDCAEILIGADHHWLCWSLGCKLYLRVSFYTGGERTYRINDRKALQDELIEYHLPCELSVDTFNRKRLADLGLRRILNFVDKVK